jgi:hypothetical protein
MSIAANTIGVRGGCSWTLSEGVELKDCLKLLPLACLMMLILLIRSVGGLASELALPDIQILMARVAENQRQSWEARANFVYRQQVHLRFLRSRGQVCRDEYRYYDVFPQSQSTEKKLIQFNGRYYKDGKFFDYDKPGFTYKDIDIDGEVINDLAEDLTNDKNSRDGLISELFPLKAEEQINYCYRLAGTMKYKGRDAFVVRFDPMKLKEGREEDSGPCWGGEILLDALELQPLLITSRFVEKIPFWVKTALGTNLQHLGFKVEYQKFSDGIWFPIAYGGEFNLKVLHFYKRNMIVSLENKDFRRTEIQTQLSFDLPASE